MLTAQNLIDTARAALQDPAPGANWSDTDLLGYVNEFQRATAFLKPDAYTVREFIPLVSGTKQTLPEAGIAVMDLGENESTGRMATLIDLEMLTHANRFWPAATQETEVQHWAADPRDPRRFDVTPPNNGYGMVECLYGAVPDAVGLDDAIAYPDSYEAAALSYLQGKAYAKNSARQDMGKSAAHMADYRNALGIKSAAQTAVAPRVGADR